MPKPLQVFLCHASQDKPEVWKLHRYLKSRGAKPWLDQADLLPGEDWEIEIPKALFASDVILVCLSKNSVNKEGFVQKEIAFALDKALEKPQGTIFIIPVKLEDCELPSRLSRYQAVDLFRTDGRKRLLMGLNKRIANLGEEVLPITIEDTKQKTPKPLKPEIQQEEKLVKPHLEKIKEAPVVEEKNEQAKPFTRILNPSALAPQKKSESKQPAQNYNLRKIGIGVFIFIAVFGILFAGNYFLNNLLANEDIGSTDVGKDDMTLMYVPAGEFTMGSDDGESDEQPIHEVTLDAFWIDQTEVTNTMYAKCVDANQCNLPSNINAFNNREYANHPVIHVSWNDAVAYCDYVDRRLPTEAEWEKAARGTNGSMYPWGDTNLKDSLLNFNSNVGDTTEVGSYPQGASIYGALDLSGNVWEWVNDWYDGSYYQNSPSSNPLGPSTGEYKVLRGGSWDFDASNVSSANRNYLAPKDSSYYVVGFRCSRSP